MEDFKDVMLSEPPSRFAQQGAPTIQSVSLENYKGILLCDRPVNLRAAKPGAGLARAAGDSGAAPFLPAGRPDERHLGLPPGAEERARREALRLGARREGAAQGVATGARAALSKHRQWLQSFAKAVREMRERDEGEPERMRERLMRIRDREAEARRAHLAQRTSDAVPHDGTSGAYRVDVPDARTSAPEKAPAAAARNLPPRRGKAKAGKPKWAMTEDEALEAAWDEELGASKDLIQFAKGLDYAKFIGDYEIKEALSVMRDRVREIAASSRLPADVLIPPGTEGDLDEGAAGDVGGGDDDDDDDDDGIDGLSEAPSAATTTTREAFMAGARQRRAARRRLRETELLHHAARSLPAGSAQHEQQWDSSARLGSLLRKCISDDALVLADRILLTSDTLRQVHTRQSLARLLQRCALTGEDGTRAMQNTAMVARAGGQLIREEAAVPPPVVVTASAEATGLQAGAAPARRILTELRKAKDRVQNLPYMYRCPSL